MSNDLETKLLQLGKDAVDGMVAGYQAHMAASRWEKSYASFINTMLARDDLNAAHMKAMADELATHGNERAVEMAEAASERMARVVAKMKAAADAPDKTAN